MWPSQGAVRLNDTMGCGASSVLISIPQNTDLPAAITTETQSVESCKPTTIMPETHTAAPGEHEPSHKCSGDQPSDYTSSDQLSGLPERLLKNMEAGFRRRRESFVKEIFEKHMRAETGGISKEDLSSALRDLNIRVSSSEEKELFYTYDLNNDGCIDLGDFRLIVARVGKVEQWATGLPLAQLLADCMPSEDEGDPIRGISRLLPAHIKAITECYSRGLAELLTEEADKLKQAHEEMDRKSHAESQGPASSKFGVPREMSCGNISDFLSGLTGRIGDPYLDFEHAMEAEHCHRDDSETLFTTRNYQIETCSKREWNIIVHGEPTADMHMGRKIPSIAELLELQVTVDAKLSRVEVIAVVLYTGPLFEKYNCVLRRWPSDSFEKMSAAGSTFTTTIHVLVSAVQKLASVVKMPDGLKLYRGLGGMYMHVSCMSVCVYSCVYVYACF